MAGKHVTDLNDLVPNRDRFPAHYVTIIREAFRALGGVFPGRMQSEASSTGWPISIPGVQMRWAKLDENLVVGGTATASIWVGTDKHWDGWDEDSGQNQTVYAPPTMIGGTFSAGSWVRIVRIGRRWCVITEIGSIRCCLAETHPGYDIVFEVYPGTWNPATDNWDYSTTKAKAKDLFYADPEILPTEGATGKFVPMPSDEYGVIYMAVSGDCDSPGSCHGS